MPNTELSPPVAATDISEDDHGFVRAEWCESPRDNTFHALLGPTSGYGRSLAGYLIEAWGEWVGEWPTTGPVLTREEEPLYGRVDGARIRWEHDPSDGPYLEGDRIADDRFRICLVGPCQSKAQELRLRRGIQALRAVTVYGRRTQRRTRKEFVDQIRSALCALPPNRRGLWDVLASLEFQRSQFYRELERVGLPPWRTLRRQLLVETRGRFASKNHAWSP